MPGGRRAKSICPAADPTTSNGDTYVSEMRATVYLIPAEGNCWISIWTTGGYILRSWATMDKCTRQAGKGIGMRKSPSGGGVDDA